MPNALLDHLSSEFQTLRAQIEGVQGTAAADGRDLSEPEQANVNAWLERAEALRPRLVDMANQEASFAATSDALSRVVRSSESVAVVRGSTTTDEPIYRSAGAYIVDLIRSREDHSAMERITRALADQTTADTPGILPTPIIGPAVNVIDATRPVWNSFTSRPMPGAGKVFSRPVVSQHTDVQVQATEKTQVASRKMTVTGLNVTKSTLGGAVDISVQDVDWTDPAALDLLIGDLLDVYAMQTDAMAGTNLVSGATGTAVPLPVTPSAQDVITALYTAAANVYAGCKRLPDTAWAAVDTWAYLGGLSDTTERPLFPTLSPMNAPGQMGATSFAGNPLGLRLVVGPQLPSKTLIVGCSAYAESYEDRKGIVRAFEVDLLGWQVGTYGYVATVLTEPTAFVPITGIVGVEVGSGSSSSSRSSKSSS